MTMMETATFLRMLRSFDSTSSVLHAIPRIFNTAERIIRTVTLFNNVELVSVKHIKLPFLPYTSSTYASSIACSTSTEERIGGSGKEINVKLRSDKTHWLPKGVRKNSSECEDLRLTRTRYVQNRD